MGCCGNGVLVCHVSWMWEARVAYRFDSTQYSPHLPALVILKREEITWCAVRTQDTPPLLLSTKLTLQIQTVPRLIHLLATLPPSFLRTTTSYTRSTSPPQTKSSGRSGMTIQEAKAQEKHRYKVVQRDRILGCACFEDKPAQRDADRCESCHANMGDSEGHIVMSPSSDRSTEL